MLPNRMCNKDCQFGRPNPMSHQIVRFPVDDICQDILVAEIPLIISSLHNDCRECTQESYWGKLPWPALMVLEIGVGGETSSSK